MTAEHGKLIGLRPGSTEVTAEFQGMTSTVPLKVDVTADVEIDKIAVEPGDVPLRPGETYPLKAIGYKDGRSVGDITGLGDLTWKSSNPDVAHITGSSVVAAGLGQSQVTVERKLPSTTGTGGEGVKLPSFRERGRGEGVWIPARPGDRFQHDPRRPARGARGD